MSGQKMETRIAPGDQDAWSCREDLNLAHTNPLGLACSQLWTQPSPMTGYRLYEHTFLQDTMDSHFPGSHITASGLAPAGWKPAPCVRGTQASKLWVPHSPGVEAPGDSGLPSSDVHSTVSNPDKQQNWGTSALECPLGLNPGSSTY